MKLLNKANCAFVINTQSGAVKVKSGDIVEVTKEIGEKLISCYPNAWKNLDEITIKAPETPKQEEVKEEVEEPKKTTAKKKK
jgi:hypothetical protein